MLSPSEQRGNLQSQLSLGTQLVSGWTEEIKAALRSQGFYWNHMGEDKLFNMETRVLQSQLLQGEELIYTD